MQRPYDHPALAATLFGGESGPPLPSTDREHPVDFDLGPEHGGAAGAGLYVNCSAHGPALLVLLAGTDSAASQAERWTRWGTELHCDVLLADHPGVGAGVGPASLSAARASARAALEYLLSRPVEEIPGVVVLGRGLGAVLAADAVAHTPSSRVRGLVLETGPAELISAYGTSLPWDELPDAEEAQRALREDFNLRELLTGTGCPLLVLHPQQEPAFPFDHGERLAQWGGGELVILSRGDRDDVPGLNSAEYRKALDTFLSEHARFEEGGEEARPAD